MKRQKKTKKDKKKKKNYIVVQLGMGVKTFSFKIVG